MAKYELDMTRGPISQQIVRYSTPLLLTGILQLFYNAADTIVVGQFAGKMALASVGATGIVSGLLVNLFMGLSAGSSVVTANSYGAGNFQRIRAAVHTSITVAAICGVFLIFAGFGLIRPLLELMNTPADIIDGSTLYLKIIFLGAPFNLIYNFGSAILRAMGDTRRPLFFLCISGLVNVLLNLLFVIVFHMSVVGVALATIIAQAVSAIMVLCCMIRSDGYIHLDLKKLSIDRDIFKELLRIGLPAGLQNSLFSISNILIQSSINSFGSDAVAGDSAACSLEGFVGCITAAIHDTTITFSGQNYGAKQYRRMRKGYVRCVLFGGLACVVVGNLVYLFHEPLLRLYNSDPNVIEMGRIRMLCIFPFYLIGALLNINSGQLRGMGYSVIPTIISLTGTVAFRVFWIYVVFMPFPTLLNLYMVYPISWGLMALALYVLYIVVRRKLPKEDQPLASV